MEKSIIPLVAGEWIPTALQLPEFDEFEPRVIRAVLSNGQILPAFWVGDPITGVAWWVDHNYTVMQSYPSHWYKGQAKSLEELPPFPEIVGNCQTCKKPSRYIHNAQCMQCYTEWRDRAAQNLRKISYVP